MKGVIRSVGVIIFRKTKRGREYLLLQHSGTSKHWGPPKGKIAKGESEKKAALRELTEESGIRDVKLLNFKHIEKYTFVSKGKTFNKTVIFFLGEVIEPRVTLSHEHINYSWNTIEEVMSKLGLESSKLMYNKVHAFLSGKKRSV